MSLEIAVVSDTHWRGPNPDLERLVHRMQGADLILHAGDATVLEVLEVLEQVAPVWAVAGNCCQAALRRQLPEQRVDEIEGLRIGMLHGHRVNLEHPGSVLSKFAEDVVLVVHGHTHVPRLENYLGRWIFNPGSVSEPRLGCPASYGWIHWHQGQLRLEHRPF